MIFFNAGGQGGLFHGGGDKGQVCDESDPRAAAPGQERRQQACGQVHSRGQRAIRSAHELRRAWCKYPNT